MTTPNLCSRIGLVALLAASLVLVVGAVPSGADLGGFGAIRDHGRGAWFRSVCDVSFGNSAACQAQVVSDSSGDPLATSSPPATALTPAQFHSAYQLPTNAPGTTAPTVAIVDAYDDPNAESDLATFDGLEGLTACTTANGCFKKVSQTGTTKYPASNSGWALEISLDVQTVHSICHNCNILLVEATSPTDANLGAAENEAVALGAVAISNSWGGNEFSGETTYDATYFNHPGIAITVSSGDSGYGVEWPAASPTVTAVGGTTLNLDSSGNYVSESAWSGGGSGCSTQEARPSWQTGACTHRTVVDVAADADPNTGAAVYDSVPYSGQSGWFQVGGTSLASPIIASIYALAGANGTNVNGGSIPYAYLGNAAALHDVVTGSNTTSSCSPAYLCTAGVGYDGPTGVGTPNGISAFSVAPPPPPTPDFSLAASAQSGTVVSGTGGAPTYTVTVTDTGGFAGAVTLGTTGLPATVTSSFSPSSTSSPVTLTLTVPSTVASGSYSFQITGAGPGPGGTPTHSVAATLVVTAPPPPNFTISVQPGSQTIGGSASATYTVTITPINGLSAPVTLSVSGLPNRTTAAFSPTSATAPAWSSTLTVTAKNARRVTNATVTITGKSGSVSHSATVRLSIS
jgi:subtilase family serine protease